MIRTLPPLHESQNCRPPARTLDDASPRRRVARASAQAQASRTCKERVIEALLFLAALVSVFTTVGIVYILV